MDEAENLRRQAKRALRLAEAILDQQTIQALTAHAATLLERAQSLEQTPPVLSDQQPQGHDDWSGPVASSRKSND